MPLLLVVGVGCSAGSAGVDATADSGYTKIDDMENGGYHTEWAPAGLTPGPWWSFVDCTEPGSDISPAPTSTDAGGWSFAAVATPYETFPGVLSHNAARLRTTSPLSGVWGAEIGFEFADVPDADAAASPWTSDGGVVNDAAGCPIVLGWNATTVDLSAYSGITFWAMADQAGGHALTVALGDRSTDPRGGICDAGGDTSDCFNSFATTFNLTGTVTRYTIDFSSLHQGAGWGFRPDPDVPDLQHVFDLSFQMYLPTCADSASKTMCAGGAPSLSFDLWIDDVYFVNKVVEQ